MDVTMRIIIAYTLWTLSWDRQSTLFRPTHLILSTTFSRVRLWGTERLSHSFTTLNLIQFTSRVRVQSLWLLHFTDEKTKAYDGDVIYFISHGQSGQSNHLGAWVSGKPSPTPESNLVPAPEVGMFVIFYPVTFLYRQSNESCYSLYEIHSGEGIFVTKPDKFATDGICFYDECKRIGSEGRNRLGLSTHYAWHSMHHCKNWSRQI